MNNFSNFLPYGYQVLEQLNYNSQGGRITYKAREINTQKLVVIKQFRFATTSHWGDYKEIEREINVLKGLNHSGIPRYLTQFAPGEGLCLVQEYIEAKPLSHLRSFTPEEIKSIAVQLLEILVALQRRIPPIIHRDLKPENVLVDEQVKVYLIDFGLARISHNTLALSSMMGGTLGFMPPEQVHNQKLTQASDLYGLGATLICLITQTKSIDIGSLVDFSTNTINFRPKVSNLNPRFLDWLEKMVEPNPATRYQNATVALKALKPIDVVRVPVQLSVSSSRIGDKQHNGMRTNSSPNPVLEKLLCLTPQLSTSWEDTEKTSSPSLFFQTHNVPSPLNKLKRWINENRETLIEQLIVYSLAFGCFSLIFWVFYQKNLAELEARREAQKNLFLMGYKNQAILINQAQLDKLKSLDADFLSRITLDCSQKSFVISFSDSYELRKISPSQVPLDALNCLPTPSTPTEE